MVQVAKTVSSWPINALSRGAKPGTREKKAQSERTMPDPAEIQKTEQSDDRLVLLANP